MNDKETGLFFDIKLGYAVKLKSSVIDDNISYLISNGLRDPTIKDITSDVKSDGLIGEFGIGLEYKHSSFNISIGMQSLNSKIQYQEFNKSSNYYIPYCIFKYGSSIFLNKK